MVSVTPANTFMKNDDVQGHRFIKNTGTTERVDSWNKNKLVGISKVG